MQLLLQRDHFSGRTNLILKKKKKKKTKKVYKRQKTNVVDYKWLMILC